MYDGRDDNESKEEIGMWSYDGQNNNRSEEDDWMQSHDGQDNDGNGENAVVRWLGWLSSAKRMTMEEGRTALMWLWIPSYCWSLDW